MSDGNLLADVPTKLSEEEFRILFASEHVRIERIVSTGQVSADWYDQHDAEWVLVLAGAASLRFEDEEDARDLRAGDYVFIAPHRRHRVTWTDPAHPTVWLAVHFSESERAASAFELVLRDPPSPPLRGGPPPRCGGG